MLCLLRVSLMFISFLFICIFGILRCLIFLRNSNNTTFLGKLIGKISYFLGITLVIKYPKNFNIPKSCIYISNHQSNYDLIIASNCIQNNTVTVGKRSIIFIPIFGILYWLAGNILLNRNHKVKAYYTLSRAAKYVKSRNMSLWIFPEGTRSYDRGLLPFKRGAFYTAIIFDMPIVPICISSFSSSVKLNRWKNGIVFIEFLNPIHHYGYDVNGLRNHCKEVMENKLISLNKEVENYNKMYLKK